MKRLLDVCGAGVGGILILPLAAVCAAAIWLADGPPILFRQRRVGREGRAFGLLKFRTMVRDAMQRGPAITIGRDPRITVVGGFLRRTKCDELPQLWNVLRGEMSLVGPRPEVAEYVARYSEAQRAVLALVPGITDPASLMFIDEAAILARHADPDRYYTDVLMPTKIRINLAYAARASSITDLVVIWATVLRWPGLLRHLLPWLPTDFLARRGV